MKTCLSRLASSPCQGQGLWGGEVPRLPQAQHISLCSVCTHPGRLTSALVAPWHKQFLVCDRTAAPGTGGSQGCSAPAGPAGHLHTSSVCQHCLGSGTAQLWRHQGGCWKWLWAPMAPDPSSAALESTGTCVLPSPKLHCCRLCWLSGAATSRDVKLGQM